MIKQVFLLWNDDLRPRDDGAVIGVFLSEADAEDGWRRYCDSRQYNRDVGTHKSGLDRGTHTIEMRTLGRVQTEASEGDDGEFG